MLIAKGDQLFLYLEVKADLGGVNPDGFLEMNKKSKVVGCLYIAICY